MNHRECQKTISKNVQEFQKVFMILNNCSEKHEQMFMGLKKMFTWDLKNVHKRFRKSMEKCSWNSKKKFKRV